MGNRLVKFLSEVLPTHNQYNHLDNTRLRMKSRNDLAQVRSNIQKVAFKIDELCYMNEQKQHQKSNKKRDKHVSFDPKVERNHQHFVNNQTCSSSPINWDGADAPLTPPQISPTNSDDIPDLSFSSGSSSSSQSSISNDSSKNQQMQANSMLDFSSTKKSGESSSNFVNDWEPFGDWKITDEIGRFENIQSQSNVENTCDDSKEFHQNADGPSTQPVDEHEHNRASVTVSEEGQSLESSQNDEYYDADDCEEEYYDDDSDSTDSDDQYYEGIDSTGLDAIDELSFVERIALENSALSIDKLHEDDGDDSDADDSWAQNDDGDDNSSVSNSSEHGEDGLLEKESMIQISDECTDIKSDDENEDISQVSPNEEKLNKLQSTQNLDTGRKSDDENFQPNCELKNSKDSETSNYECELNTSNASSITADFFEHEELKREISDEFTADFDTCSRCDKTISTASTEALTIEEDSDCDSTSCCSNEDLDDSNGILGIARRDGFIPTIEDLKPTRGKRYRVVSKKLGTLSKLEYLESKLRSIENENFTKNVSPNQSKNILKPTHLSSCMKTVPSSSLKKNVPDLMDHSKRSLSQQSRTPGSARRSTVTKNKPLETKRTITKVESSKDNTGKISGKTKQKATDENTPKSSMPQSKSRSSRFERIRKSAAWRHKYARMEGNP